MAKWIELQAVTIPIWRRMYPVIRSHFSMGFSPLEFRFQVEFIIKLKTQAPKIDNLYPPSLSRANISQKKCKNQRAKSTRKGKVFFTHPSHEERRHGQEIK
jgi:hypothetical protein